MNLEAISTVELVKKFTSLEYEIDAKILLYEEIYNELVRRFPPLKEDVKPMEYKRKNL